MCFFLPKMTEIDSVNRNRLQEGNRFPFLFFAIQTLSVILFRIEKFFDEWSRLTLHSVQCPTCLICLFYCSIKFKRHFRHTLKLLIRAEQFEENLAAAPSEPNDRHWQFSPDDDLERDDGWSAWRHHCNKTIDFPKFYWWGGSYPMYFDFPPPMNNVSTSVLICSYSGGKFMMSDICSSIASRLALQINRPELSSYAINISRKSRTPLFWNFEVENLQILRTRRTNLTERFERILKDLIHRSSCSNDIFLVLNLMQIIQQNPRVKRNFTDRCAGRGRDINDDQLS